METYIVINFHNEEEVHKVIKILLTHKYYFSHIYAHKTNKKRLSNFDEIIPLFTIFPCSILLGGTFCKNEWLIYPNLIFYKDEIYNVMTVDEFLTNHTNFASEKYIKKYGIVMDVTPT